MNKKYRIRIDIINLVIRFMVFCTVASFILFSITGLDYYIWKGLMLIPAAIISFIIRKYSKNIWSFIIFHLLLLMVYLFLADELVLRVVYGINIFAFAISEFVLNIDKTIKNTPFVFSIIHIALYALCKGVFPEEYMLGLFFFSTAIVFGLLYIINMYYVNSYNYLSKYEDKVNIPIKKIQSTSTFYLGVFLILCLAVMILFTRIPLGGIGRFFRNNLVRFIKFLISSAILIIKKPEEVAATLEEEVLNFNGPPIMPEPTLFTEITNAFIGVITVIVVLVVIIYGLYRIYKLFYSKVVIIDEVRTEKITPFIKDNNKKDSKSSTVRRRIRTLFDSSNNIKIRRLYIRAVQKNAQTDNILKYKLPKELSEYVLGPDNHNMDELTVQKKRAELTAIYEKARYSNRECSKEEVKLVKDILKYGGGRRMS